MTSTLENDHGKYGQRGFPGWQGKLHHQGDFGKLAGESPPLIADGRALQGQSESYNQNTQRLGRELMTPAELATMPGDRCILQASGPAPVLFPKVRLEAAPNYKYTAEGD